MFAWVQPGLVNARLSELAAPHGLHFAPDPSSQPVSTIGGNVAANAGGPHCLKHGVTANHVLGLVVVLHDGAVVTLGGEAPGLAGRGPRLGGGRQRGHARASCARSACGSCRGPRPCTP